MVSAVPLVVRDILTFIRYFYLTDLIAQGTVDEVHYCPTEAMTADYMTNSLQGELFKIHKKNIMGTPPN